MVGRLFLRSYSLYSIEYSGRIVSERHPDPLALLSCTVDNKEDQYNKYLFHLA